MNRHPLVSELVARRREVGLTQTELGQRLCRSTKAISHFEADPGGRNLAVIDEVARELGMRLALVPIEDDGSRHD